MREARYATAVMYKNIATGQLQVPVSLRQTATVDMHWQAKTKNTISDSAELNVKVRLASFA